jgi:hypothetical protein
VPHRILLISFLAHLRERISRLGPGWQANPRLTRKPDMWSSGTADVR